MRSILLRGAIATLGCVGLVVSARAIARSKAPVTVSPASSASATAATVTKSDAGTMHAPEVSTAGTQFVRTRFVDALDQAKIEVPELTRGRAILAKHWRKMRPPWTKLGPEAADLATSIVIRTSETEVEWAMPTSSGKVWSPDAKIWNMSEGSYDQRESLFLPTPARVTYRSHIPDDARIEYAASVAEKSSDEVSFAVVVRDGAAPEKRICEVSLPPAMQGGQWKDVSCSLADYRGKDVELSFVTKSHGGEVVSALMGNPTLVGAGSAERELPYNVLFVVVDALRSDVLASFHDDETDARMANAKVPPLDAWLPKIRGLTPALDELAKTGVRFTAAHSNGAWTRPGTLAMLAGARSRELAVDTLGWLLTDKAARSFYASEPPLLPLLFRERGAAVPAFVNNFFMAGYAPVAVDMGFERMADYRYRFKDTDFIASDAIHWIEAHKDTRFFAFCNFNSPHEPWEPPARFLERVPPPPAGPKDDIVRRYLGEAAKDDEAIGKLLATLDALHLREKTLVVVTADHGETLSLAHDGRSKLDNMKIRFHHAVGDYEETTRIPIIMSLPGVLPADKIVRERIRNIDIAPTILELEGLPANRKSSGLTLMPLVRGEKEADERPTVSEGRGMRALLFGKYRLLIREGAAQIIIDKDQERSVHEELYDLESDPGERKNLASELPHVMDEMRARLSAVEKNVPVVGTEESTAASPLGHVELRFAAGGSAHRLSGHVRATGGTISVTPIGLGKEAFREEAGMIEIGASIPAKEVVGLVLDVNPPSAQLTWDFFVDDQPWPAERFFKGGLGLVEPRLAHGLPKELSRRSIASKSPPFIDPVRDFGAFVLVSGGDVVSEEEGGAGMEEMGRILKDWGYASDEKKGKPVPKK